MRISEPLQPSIHNVQAVIQNCLTYEEPGKCDPVLRKTTIETSQEIP